MSGLGAQREVAHEGVPDAIRQRIQSLVATRDDIVSVYVAGSAVQAGRITGHDVDVRVIVDSDPERIPKRGDYERVGDTLVDWSFQHRSAYEPVDALLRVSWLCPNVVEGHVVHDPRGFFTELQAEVRRRYHEPDALRARVAERLAQLRHLIAHAEESARARDLFELLTSTLAASRWVGSLPAVMLCRTPTTRGRLLLLRDCLARLGRSDLYTLALRLHGADRVTPEAVRRGLDAALGLYDRANSVVDAAVSRQPDLAKVRRMLDPLKRDYWRAGIAELLDQGHHREAMSPLLQIAGFSLCFVIAAVGEQHGLLGIAGANGILAQAGFLGPRSLEQKTTLLRQYLVEMEALTERLPFPQSSPGGAP